MAKSRIKSLRRMAVYARYRTRRDEAGQEELVTLLWAIAVIEQARDDLGKDGWGELVTRARQREVRLEPESDWMRRSRNGAVTLT